MNHITCFDRIVRQSRKEKIINIIHREGRGTGALQNLRKSNQ